MTCISISTKLSNHVISRWYFFSCQSQINQINCALYKIAKFYGKFTFILPLIQFDSIFWKLNFNESTFFLIDECLTCVFILNLIQFCSTDWLNERMSNNMKCFSKIWFSSTVIKTNYNWLVPRAQEKGVNLYYKRWESIICGATHFGTTWWEADLMLKWCR